MISFIHLVGNDKLPKIAFMDTLLIQPENSDQLAAVKAVLKALKVPYQLQRDDTPAVTAVEIDEAYREKRDGKYVVLDVNDLWK